MQPQMDIRKTIRGPVPRLPYERIARAILPGDYQLSLVLCGDELARRINREHRKKSYRPNVLSFPLSKNEGEIFLNIRCAEREARRFGMTTSERAALLYVHGLFHLIGYDHGAAMEKKEVAILRKFGFVTRN